MLLVSCCTPLAQAPIASVVAPKELVHVVNFVFRRDSRLAWTPLKVSRQLSKSDVLAQFLKRVGLISF